MQQLQAKLRFSRTLNWLLGLLALFLSAVLIFWQPGTDAGQTPSAETVADVQDPAEPTGDQNELDAASGSGADGDASPSAAPEHIRGIEGDPLAVGSIDAPVVISEWTDYRCPYCALFATETLPVLMEEYVDTGVVRIEFNDVYFFGDESLDAAVAARAAANQGYYIPFIETLYAAAPEKGGHPPMPRETLIGFAETAGVPDLARFETDLDDPALLEAVQRSHEQAVAWGITSVPFFVIGDQAVPGAQPLEVFRELIEGAQN